MNKEGTVSKNINKKRGFLFDLSPYSRIFRVQQRLVDLTLTGSAKGAWELIKAFHIVFKAWLHLQGEEGDKYSTIGH